MGLALENMFLDKAFFPSEDELNDLKLNQAYINWVTLIKAVSDPAMA